MTRTAAEPLVWEHYEYGKLVQSADGPIVPGSEHGCTGRSSGFPMPVESRCHPSQVGLGERDARRWAQCRWSDTGGVASSVSFVDGTPWVICVRQRERSEAGEAQEGRLYTEAHYAVLPAEQYTYDSLPNLARVLYTEPRTTFDMQLAPLAIAPTAAAPLPSDWFAAASVMLRAVMSGVSLSVQDWELRPEEFLDSASRCLALLPRTLQWRLPLGAGMMTMENSTAMASGMVAIGGLRIIGGVPKNEADFDFSLGDHYIEWLRPLVTSCTTTSDVADVLLRELPNFAQLDAIDTATPWAETARAIATARLEKERLVEALRAVDAGEMPAIPVAFTHYRYDFLEGLYQRVAPTGNNAATTLLAGTANSGWREEWERLVVAATTSEERDRRLALAMLLGATPVSEPRLVGKVRHFDLPGPLEEQSVERLVQAFEATDAQGATEWLSMLAPPAATDALWVRRWRTDAGPRGVWMGLREILTSPQSSVLTALRDTPTAMAALGLLNAAGNDALALANLMKAAVPADLPVLDTLVDKLAAKHAVSAFQLAELASENGLTTRLETVLRGQTPTAQEQTSLEACSKQLLKELIASSTPHIGPLMLRALLRKTGTLKRSKGTATLQAELVRNIGDPYATVLLNSQPTGGLGTQHKVVDDMVAHIPLDAAIVEQLVSEWARFQGPVEERAVRLVKLWLSQDERESGQRYPVAAALRVLSGQPVKSRARLTPEERQLLRRVMAALKLTFANTWAFAQDEALMDVVADLAPPAASPALSGDQIAGLLKTTLNDERAQTAWNTRVGLRGWDRDPGWRLVNGAVVALADNEVAALLKLDGKELLQLLMRGTGLSKSMAGRIKRTDLDAILGPRATALASGSSLAARVKTLVRLWELATDDDNQRLVRDVGIVALQLAASDKMKKSEVVASMTAETGWLERVKRGVRGPATLVELLREITKTLDVKPAQFVSQYWEPKSK